jgi:DNA-binding MarR family transcriptional regulator
MRYEGPMSDEAAEAAQLGEVLGFMRLLWAVDHGLQSTSKRMAAELGVTGPQRLVVRIVGRFPGISQAAIAEILHVHPSTVTGVQRRLVERGLIERRTDPSDARRAQLYLTEAGRAIDSLRAGTVEAAVRRALSQVGRDRLAAAENVLSAVAAELNGEEEPEPERKRGR